MQSPPGRAAYNISTKTAARGALFAHHCCFRVTMAAGIRAQIGWSNVGGLVMRTTAFIAAPRPLASRSELNPANKLFHSLSWERTVLSFLAKVERLPLDLKAEIADRVGQFISFARTAALTRFIEAAAAEREKVSRRARFTTNPLWSAVALAEAWCVTRLGFSDGALNRYSALSVRTAIETFASEHPPREAKTKVGCAVQ